MPYRNIAVDYSLSKLEKLGLPKSIEKDIVKFHSLPSNFPMLAEYIEEAVLDDKHEYETVKKIHELIMHLYPKFLINDFRGALRPRTGDVLKKTGGMTFDIFYELSEPFLGKQFIVVDLYERIPVDGHIINSFLKKIEWSKNLKDKRLV